MTGRYDAGDGCTAETWTTGYYQRMMLSAPVIMRLR